MAKSAMQSLGLEKVVWIPTGKPGYRKPPVAHYIVENKLYR